MVKRLENGFTLVEMVAALTVLALLAAIVGPLLSNGARAYNDSAAAIHTLSKVRFASERLVREIREVSNTGAYDILTSVASPNSTLRFIKTDTETVTISSAPPLLTMAYDSVSAANPYTLSDELSSITFRYWQSDGSTPASNNTDIAFIEFELVLAHGGNNYAQRSRIALRNRP
jgi:prepilin-type N-terminal cleavage/methylation domain-containing protein